MIIYIPILVLVVQSFSTHIDPMNCSLPSSCVHGILQARILDWVAIPSPRDLPDPGIKPGSPALQADSLPAEPQNDDEVIKYLLNTL